MSDPNHQYDHEFIKCRNCGNEYFKSWAHCPNCKTKTKRDYSGLVFLILILAIAAAALTNNPVKAYVLERANMGKQLISEGRPFEKDIMEVFSEPEQPLPESGLYQVFTPNELLSVFTVISGDTIGHRLLKFVSVETNEAEFTMFVREKQRVEIPVPLGTYQILIATGHTWYGDEHLFGPETMYLKLDNVYSFQSILGGIQTWTVDFTPRTDGNLRTNYIPSSDW